MKTADDYRNEFYFWWILSMCKLRRITHKLSKALRRRLHIYKIHKNNKFIPYNSNFNCHQNLIFVIIVHFRNRRKENSSEIPAHENRSVKRFLQPIKLHEISIMMRSWNYYIMTSNFRQSNWESRYIRKCIRTLICPLS